MTDDMTQTPTDARNKDTDRTVSQAEQTEQREQAETTLSATGEDGAWKKRVALFLTSQFLSLLGSNIAYFVITWYLTLTQKSGAVLTLMLLFGMGPQALVSLFGGALADRLSRKAIIIVSDTTIAVATVALVFWMMVGHTDLWLFYLIAAIRSVGQGFQNPAVGAVLPQLTPSEHLARVNGINGTMQATMQLVSPALGGLVYGVWGVIPAFWIDAATALMGVSILAFIAIPKLETPASSGHIIQDLTDGVRYIFTHPVLRWVMIVHSFIFLLAAAPSVLLPLQIARSFGGEVWKLTASETLFAVGLMLGGLLMSSVLATAHKARLLLAACICFGVFTIGTGIAPLIGAGQVLWGETPGLWVLYAFLMLIGLSIPPYDVASLTYLQQGSEAEYMGRVSSFVSLITTVSIPLGMLILGPLADVTSVETVFIGCGILCLTVTLVSFLLPTGRRLLREPDLRASEEK